MAVAALRKDDPVRLGDYVLLGRLGEGGQGIVYLGRRGGGGDQVAVKLLGAAGAESEMARMRFMREVEVVMAVQEFCTARVLDRGMEEGRPFIVSEYVPGPSLQQRVNEGGPLRGGELQRVAIGVATALVAIHQKGIVHRDLKPQNVLLGPDGPRVIDFGIARALDVSTQTTRMVGTPLYMAPEQVRAESAAPPIDVFAWAATVVFAANGAPPFGADSLPAVIHRILTGEPDLGNLDGRLRDIAARCLDKDARRRPDAARLLLSLLGQEVAPEPVAAGASHEAPSSAQLQSLPAELMEEGRRLAALQQSNGTTGGHATDPADVSFGERGRTSPAGGSASWGRTAPPHEVPLYTTADRPAGTPVPQGSYPPPAPMPAGFPFGQHTQPPVERRRKRSGLRWAVGSAVVMLLLVGAVAVLLFLPRLLAADDGGYQEKPTHTPTPTQTTGEPYWGNDDGNDPY